MTFAANSLGVMLIALFSINTFGQTCKTVVDKPPRPPVADTQAYCVVIGKTVFSAWKNATDSTAGIKIYLKGKDSDIVPEKNANSRAQILSDVLIMRLRYWAPKNITPYRVTLHFDSFSPTPSKYESNHKLTISLDGKPFLAETMKMEESITNVEFFSLELTYPDFLQFARAKKVSIQFGNTKIRFHKKEMEALNLLNEAAKSLKPSVVFM
jgi:hypothetical protein